MIKNWEIGEKIDDYITGKLSKEGLFEWEYKNRDILANEKDFEYFENWLMKDSLYLIKDLSECDEGGVIKEALSDVRDCLLKRKDYIRTKFFYGTWPPESKKDKQDIEKSKKTLKSFLSGNYNKESMLKEIIELEDSINKGYALGLISTEALHHLKSKLQGERFYDGYSHFSAESIKYLRESFPKIESHGIELHDLFKTFENEHDKKGVLEKRVNDLYNCLIERYPFTVSLVHTKDDKLFTSFNIIKL